MRNSGSAELAHARLRARWGLRADESTWHRLEITRDLAPLLELAHGSSLAHWVRDLTPAAGLHLIDETLRCRWREQVSEVAGWVDVSWQASVNACAALGDVPLRPGWLHRWRQGLPAGQAKATLEASLLPLIAAHLRRFADPATRDGWAERRALGSQLVALMRRHPAEPVEAFIFLALQALELERLRAEIVGRAAFPRRTLHA